MADPVGGHRVAGSRLFRSLVLGGADDTPRNFVAPLLGLAVMGAAIWSAAAAFRSLPHEPARALTIFALAPALFVVSWPFAGTEATGPFAGTEATGRPALGEHSVGVLWLSGPLLLTAIYHVV